MHHIPPLTSVSRNLGLRSDRERLKDNFRISCPLTLPLPSGERELGDVISEPFLGKSLVIRPQQVQDRSMQIVQMHFVFGGKRAKFVGRPKPNATVTSVVPMQNALETVTS